MEKLLDKIRAFNLAPWLAIFYSVGLAGMMIPATRELFKDLTPFNLLLNLLILLIYHGKFSASFILKALFIGAAGIVVEMVGVNTGLIFGEYEYGETLGLQIWHTPLMIGVNWLMLVYTSLVITSKYISDRYVRVVLAAVLMVVYDIALEPSAIYLDMWDWGGPVPLQNYIAWLVISFFLILFAEHTNTVNRANKMAAPLFFIQFIFFIILDIWFYIIN